MAAPSRQRVRDTPVEEVWRLLQTLMRRQQRRFLSVAAELNLHPAQAGALVQMQPDTPVSMHELAATLHCDNSNVTGLVDRLEARGLVERRPHEHDRRIRQIVLTAEGVETNGRIRTAMAATPEAISRLPRADQRALRDILRRALAGEG